MSSSSSLTRIETIENEQTKLLASAFNTAATSSFTVGVLAPVATAFYGTLGKPIDPVLLVTGVAIWTLAAFWLHSHAKGFLEGLN